MAKEFFIHLADPGFPDPPWPGARRLGPFVSSEDATAQAVSDLAGGYIAEENFIGIYTGEESDKLADDPSARVKAEVTHSKLKGRVATFRKKLLSDQVGAVEAQRESIEAILPEGVGYDDLMSIARTMRRNALELAREVSP